jgi:serine phosphatase RsbU (regulator of sigma subunit)
VSSGAFEQVNAGHPPTLIRHGETWLRLEATVPPIGVLPDIQTEPQCLTLQPQDMVICYSDGFSEIETAAGLWGEAGLLGAVPDRLSNAQTVIDHIVAAAQRVTQTEDIHDDQTLIVMGME